MRKIIVFAFCFCVFFCQQSMAQDVSRWSGSARLEMTGGLNYHFGADVLIDGSGAMTVKLTSEFDSMLLPSAVLWPPVPASIERGFALFAPYYDGSDFKARYGIRITTDQFTIVIVPVSFQVQQVLSLLHLSYQASVVLSRGYPDSCTGASAMFSRQVPCEADAAIEVRR